MGPGPREGAGACSFAARAGGGAVGKDRAAPAGADDPGGPVAETLRKTVGPPGGGSSVPRGPGG